MAGTSTGLDEKVAGALCYVAGWLSGLIFLILEKDNKFIRYHAMQSIITYGVIFVAYLILVQIPIFATVIFLVSWILAIGLFGVLALKAYRGEEYELRWAGKLARRWLDSENK